MASSISESDWKKFRKLREVALERFCGQTLQEVTKLAATSPLSSHQRYLKIYELIQQRDREIARMFNNPRRSQALEQLCSMHALGLLENEELDAFTDETRNVVKLFSSP
ncbi:MAG: hypothetical protein MJA27_25460 [Pseudanabaenales cyanobacterium]|nr:hypothetical protein [Pseudanabaenales cyanobacterium]